MKIAVFSDLHVHAWSEFSIDAGGASSRLRHCLSVLSEIRFYCLKHDIEHVLFGGDLFHKRGVLYTLPYNLVCEELATWKRNGLQLMANAGNHDAADRHAKVHALQALQSAELLSTVGEEGWRWWRLGDDEVLVYAVSYCAHADELRRRFEQCVAQPKPNGAFTIGLFHHGFRGARVGTSLEYVVKESASSTTYASECDLMLSGHYHAHQEIGTRGNAWYVGSPLEFVRGETSPKGFLVVDTDEAEIERIELQLPRFVKLNDHEIADDDFDLEAHVRGNFVDVVFDELPMPWEKLEATLRKLGAEGVRACPTKTARQAKSSRLQVDPLMGDKQLLESYMEHVGVDPGERDELLALGLSLIERATR